MAKYFSGIILLSIVLVITGCGKGIAPLSVQEEQQKAGFSGTITFTGTWPDSVQRTHLVVFKNPLRTAGDFSILNLNYISLSIPNGSKVVNYSSLDSSYIPIGAGEYSYIVVAQSKTPTLSLNRSDWYVVGVYYANGDTTQPGKLIIPSNTLINNINITCDFNHLPPQPPGGK
ncbi:MAG: hypothetical protein ACYDEE_12275 [Ignavibacteriaceae bacterium]